MFTVSLSGISETDGGKVALTYKGQKAPLWCVAWSPDGKRLASSGYDESIKIWEAETGKDVVSIKKTWKNPTTNALTWSPDSKRVASFSWQEKLMIYDAEKGDVVLALNAKTNTMHKMSFSPDGKHLACPWGDGSVHIWDMMAQEK